MKFIILFLIYYFVPIIMGTNTQSKSNSQSLDLSEPLFFDYDNGDKIFVTNNHEYNSKYYVHGEYLYSLVKNEVSCIDSCLSWINVISPKNTIAITGFDVRYISEENCECKGQILKRKKFQYYPYVFKIDKYNNKYYYESDLITTKINRNYFTDLKYFEYNCYETLSKFAKNKMAEALIKYVVSCDNNHCECSANLLLSY